DGIRHATSLPRAPGRLTLRGRPRGPGVLPGLRPGAPAGTPEPPVRLRRAGLPPDGWAAAGLRRRWLRVLIGLLSALGTAGALLVGLVALKLTSTDEAGFIDGPDPYSVRLQHSAAGLGPDTLTWLSLRSDDGPLSREWHLGCFNNDDPDDAFDSVTWTGPDSLEIRVTDGRTFPITLDTSGRPLTTATLGC